VIKKIFLAAVSFFLLVVLSGAYLLFTEHGSSVVVDAAQKLTQEKLQIEFFSGTLGKEFVVENLSFESTTAHVHLQSFTMSWIPWALLRGKVHIYTLSLHTLAMNSFSPEEKQKSDGTLSLPQLALPFSFEIDDLEATDIRYSTDNQTVAYIDRMDTAFLAGTNRVQLKSFHLRSSGVDLTLSGTLTPGGTWPVAMSGVWRYTGADLPELQGTCSLSDSLEDGVLQVDITMPFSAKLSTAFQVKDGVSFQAGLQIHEFDPGLLAEEYPGVVNADAVVDGRMVGDQFSADIRVHTIEGLLRSVPFNFSGAAHFADGVLDIDTAVLQSGTARLDVDGRIGREYGLQYNLNVSDLAEFNASMSGAIQVAGEITGEKDTPWIQGALSGENISGEGFSAVFLHADVAGELSSSGEITTEVLLEKVMVQDQMVERITLAAQGSLADHQLDIGALYDPISVVVTAKGAWQNDGWTGMIDTLSLSHPQQGRLDLTEQAGLFIAQQNVKLETICLSHTSGAICLEGGFADMSWQAGVTLQDFDPGFFLEEWPGAVTAAVAGRGNLAGDEQMHRVEIASLSGVVRDIPLSGAGSFELNSTSLLVSDVQLQYGDARLKVDGALQNDQYDFRYSGEIPELRAFLPEMTGRFTFSGDITGNRQAPAINLVFNATDGQMDTLSFTNVSGDIAFDLHSDGDISAVVQGENIVNNDLEVSNITLTATGTTAEHSFSLDAATSLGSGSLQGTGSYDTSWKAWLDIMDLSLQRYGSYSLQKRAMFEIGAEQSAVDDLCLQGSQVRLCLSGSVSGDKEWEIHSRVDTFSLAALEDFGLIDFTIEGELQGYLQAGGGIDSIAHLQGWISLPELMLYGDEETDLRYSFSDTRVEADMIDSTLQVNWRSVPEQSGRILGDLSVHDFGKIPTDLKELPVEGFLDFYLDDLAFVTILTNALVQPTGTFGGRLEVGGTAADPSVQGNLTLEQGDIRLVDLGIALEDVSAAVTSRQDNIEYVLTARSGPGQARGEGEIRRTDNLSWELTSHLTGTDFELFATDEYLIRTSPDVQLFLGEAGNSLVGKLDIPFARIVLSDENGKVTSSGDVVIVDQQQQSQPKNGFVLDLNIGLGEDVTIDAYGLKSGLTGALELQDAPHKNMSAYGELIVRNGEYTFYSVELEINRGRLLFSGGSIDNPGVDFRLQRKVEKVMVGVDVSGMANELEFTLFSDPAMDESNIMAYLLVGRSMYASSDNEQTLVSAAASALGIRGANTITNKLGEYVPIDEIYLDGGTGTEDMSIIMGKNITEDLFIGYDHNFFDSSGEFKVRYNLGGNFSVETRSGVGSTSGDILYSIER
jgi:autotransporter translocation and assembly factor TamB